MTVYKFIRIKGKERTWIGYFVPRMFQLTPSWDVLKTFGLSYINERLNGWAIWYVLSKEDFAKAIDTLDELKKTHIFDYEVM
jgi:hypothetical protein